jgi:hypothetical protein
MLRLYMESLQVN